MQRLGCQHDVFEELQAIWGSLLKCKVKREICRQEKLLDPDVARFHLNFMLQATGDQCWGLTTRIMNQLLPHNKPPQIAVT